jgi:hypothetical protein
MYVQRIASCVIVVLTFKPQVGYGHALKVVVAMYKPIYKPSDKCASAHEQHNRMLKCLK